MARSTGVCAALCYVLGKLDVTTKARRFCKRPRSLKSSAVGADAVAFIVTVDLAAATG
jgi:hypothetical protein